MRCVGARRRVAVASAPQPPSAQPPMQDPISRRTFNQILGAAALGGVFPTLQHPDPMPENAPPTSPSASTLSNASDELCTLSAIELARRIRQKQVSAREVMAAHLARNERVNPKI